MPPPDKKYISNAYAALKDNLEGFNKTPEEFEKLVVNDKGYRSKVYSALKDNLEGFDKTPEQFDTAITTSPLSDVTTATGGLIQPVGTYQPTKPKDAIEQMKSGGKVENGVLTVHDNTQVKSKKPDIGVAIDNLVAEKNKGFSVSKEGLKVQKDAIAKAYKNGDLVLGEDGKLKKGTGFIQSFLDANNNRFIDDLHNSVLASLDNKGKREYLKVKPLLDEKYKSKTAPSGILGKAGEFAGENAELLGKGALVAGTAGAALPEVAGASNFASFLSMADQFAKGGYSNEVQKTYNALLEQGVPEEQAMEQAHKAGLVGEATGLATGAFLSKGHLQTTPAAAKGFVKGIKKSAAKLMGYEMPKMGVVSGAQTFVNDLAELGVGVNKKAEDILNETGNSAVHGAVIGAAFYALQNPGKVLSYLRPQAENVIASMPKEQREAFVKSAEQQGVMPKGSVEAVESKVQEFEKAKSPLEKLPIPDENKAAIAGKILQKQKLQEELSNLQKHGEAFAPRIEELTNEIGGIEKEMAGIYKAKNVFNKEKDTLTGETPKNEKENPIIQEGQGKDLAENMPKAETDPTITEQSKLEPYAVSKSSTEPLGPYEGGNETTRGQESSKGVGEGHELQEPAGARSGQVEGSEVERQDKQAISPIKEFVSKQGHTLTNEDGILTVRNKDGKEVSRGTRNKVIREAAEKYDFTQGKTAPEPDFEPAHQEEYLRHVIEKTTNPVELANIYLGEEKVGKGLSTKEQMIADYGMGKVTENSYRNFADKNSQNHNKARAYFSNEGDHIDTLAKEMSDHYGVEIHPEDITNFIDRFPNGVDQATAMHESPSAKMAKDRFYELTGLPLTEDIAQLALKQRDIKEAELLSDETANIINGEGITADNLEQLKHLFDGFPYTESDYEAVRSKLGVEDKSSSEATTASEGSESGEVKIDEPITNRQRAEEIAQAILNLRSDGNNLYGGIAGVTTAIYDGMLSAAANVIRAGGTILDAIDAGINYVQSKSPKADIEKVREFLHSAFKVPYTKPTATPNTLMQGLDVADTSLRLHELGSSHEKIKEGIDSKKLGFWKTILKRGVESQVEILKRLRGLGEAGREAANYLIVSKGSSGRADAFFDKAKDAIYGGIDGFKKVAISGRKLRVTEVLNNIVTLKRIIDIDKKMSDKFAEFEKLRSDIISLKKSNPSDPNIIKLTRDYQNIKDYLDYNGVLNYEKGVYSLGQYKHPLGYTSDMAKVDLDNIKKEQPELFKELDSRTKTLSDTFHQLITLKEDAGILTKESADALREYYYAPRADINKFINSETDNTAGGGQSTKDRVGIKKLQGGNEELLSEDYNVQLQQAIHNTMRDIAMNNAGKKLLEAVRSKMGNEYLSENTPQIYTTGPNKGKLIRDKFGNIKYDDIPTGKAKINVWEDGKKVEVIADQRLVDSWYDNYKSSSLIKNIGTITGAQILRGSITGYNPGFGIFQLLVDPQSAVVASGLYKSYLGGIATIYKDMAKVSPDVFHSDGVKGIAAEARDYGAFTSFSRGEDILNLRSEVDVSKRKAMRALKTVAEAFNWVNDRAENLTRTALYSRSKELQIADYKKTNNAEPLGQDLEEIKVKAALDARKYVDFARGGDFGKELNSFFPYLNAAIQLKRSVLEAAAKDPIRMTTMTAEAVAAGLGVMAYSMGLGWASHGLSEEEKQKRLEAYRNVNQVTRSKYFLMYKGEDKDGKPQFWRIEKPMVISVAINAAERQMLKYYYPDVDLNAQNLAQDLFDQSPIDKTIASRNPTVNAFLKGYLNKDVYFNKDVVKDANNVTDYLEGTDDPKTKDFYIWLGKKAKDVGIDEGISPKRTQAAVESYTGDPSQNPITNLLTGTMAIAFDAALGNKDSLNKRLEGFKEFNNYIDFTTMPKRLIVQPSDMTVEQVNSWKQKSQQKADMKVIKKASSMGRLQD